MEGRSVVRDAPAPPGSPVAPSVSRRFERSGSPKHERGVLRCGTEQTCDAPGSTGKPSVTSGSLTGDSWAMGGRSVVRDAPAPPGSPVDPSVSRRFERSGSPKRERGECGLPPRGTLAEPRGLPPASRRPLRRALPAEGGSRRSAAALRARRCEQPAFEPHLGCGSECQGENGQDARVSPAVSSG